MFTKLIIAGSRDFTDYQLLKSTIESFNFDKDELMIVSGTAKGADKLGERWARENGVMINSYPADWDRYGKRAGYIRNAIMAENATHLIVFWDGKSKGTKNMIDSAFKKNLSVTVIKY